MKNEAGRGYVLIVDADPENMRLLQSILNRQGYSVKSAATGGEAIKSALERLPDVVLLNAVMPDMDGYEICRIMKGSPDTAGVPIIFICPPEETENRVKVFEAGGADYITGPKREVEVAAKVRIHLDISGLKHEKAELETVCRSISESEKRYRSFFNDALDMMHTVDQNGRIVEANEIELSTLGYDREELIGKFLIDIIHPDFREKTSKAMHKVLAGREVKGYETVFITKNGNRVTVEVNAFPSVEKGRVVSSRAIIRDITKRKKIEEELWKSHRLYQEAQEIARIGHWELDLVTNRLSWSDEIYRIFEVDPEQFLASYEHFLDMIHPEDREYVDRAYKISLKNRTKYNVVHRLLLSDGRVKYVREQCRTYYDGEGRPLRSLGTVQDITEIRKVEDRLKLTQKSIDSVLDCIFWIDERARFSFVNDTACRKLGYTREELLAMGVFDIDPAFSPENWPEHWQEIMKRGSMTFETIHRCKKGEEFPVEVTSNRVLFRNRYYNCAIARDITERKRAEKSLLKAKKEWERTFESIGDIALIHDTDLRITMANRKACETFSAGPEELQGKYCYEVFHGTSQPCADCPVVQSLRDKGVHGAEIKHEKLGKTFLASASPVLGDQGEITGVIHFAKDITEQRKLENQLRQAQKIEAIGTLAGGIAHDLNNILTPILGYTDMALEDLPEGSAIRQYLQEIMKAGHRAKGLVQQILTFSRQAEQERRPVQPHLIVKEALKLLRSSIPTTIEIRQKIDPESGSVLADPTQIHQIIVNLCTNAYQAMRETGGVLGVALDKIEMGPDEYPANLELKPGPYLRLEVSDTGRGMPSEIRERIFEPYFTTKKKEEGSGLGLAVVHGIVKSLKGHITVYSEPGRGSTFHVYLPGTQTVEEIAEAREVAAIPGGNERILIVDDEEEIVQLMLRMIKDLGYRVTGLTGSPEALQLFENKPREFDLVITDMTMPDMTGAELAGKILEIRPGIPIILCTGFSEIINREKAKALGIREFVMKPVIKRDIAKIIRKVVDETAASEKPGT